MNLDDIAGGVIENTAAAPATRHRACVICADLSRLGRDDLPSRLARSIVNQLIQQGHEVDVLITDPARDARDGEPASHETASINYLSEIDDPEILSRDRVSDALRVYRFVRRSDYDAVHILLPGGVGAYCAMAKRQGLIEPAIVTYVIEGSEAKRRQNVRFPDRNDFLVEALERAQCDHSDQLISMDGTLPPPNVEQRSGHRPPITRLFWPSVGAGVGGVLETRSLPESGFDKLIVLGRHDYSSGIDLLVEGLKRLPATCQPDLIFAGDFGTILGEHSGGYIVRHLAGYAGALSFLPLQCRQEIDILLGSSNALAIIPGRSRDCSWEFAQVFGSATPFLSFGATGFEDHAPAEHRSSCTAEADPGSIAEAITRVAAHGMPVIRAAYSEHDIAAGWKTALDARKTTDRRPPGPNRPLVSICVTHYERPALLREALNALASQTYENIEIVIVDDGSRGPESLAFLDDLGRQNFRFPLKIIRSPNRYLGAARNLAAAQATGDYLLFHDDDNIAEPHQISTFVAAAEASGADILTSLYWTFERDRKNRSLLCHAIGTGGPISLLENRFGDANALVRRTVFEALGGFTTQYGVGYEDWAFFLNAYLQGYRPGLIPEVLFNYRVSNTSMVASSSHHVGLDRVFHSLDAANCLFAGDLARFMSREAAERDSAERLSKALSQSNARSLHLQLAALPSNADTAWDRLSEIARIEGRADDPAKLLARQNGYASNAPQVGGAIHMDLLPTGATPAAIMVGWGLSSDGAPISPEYFRLDGRVFEVCALVRQSRPDVNARFKIADTIPTGFCLAGRLIDGLQAWRYRFGRGSKVGIANRKLNFFGVGAQATAHIDLCTAAHETEFTPPADWNGALAVEMSQVSVPFARQTGDEYQLGVQSPQSRGEFIFPDEAMTGRISVIAPMTPKADLFFQRRSNDA